jgi:glycosyltransferase involved in cell wall biosynthesis
VTKIALYFDSESVHGGSYQMCINNLNNFLEIFNKNKIQSIIFTDKKNKYLENKNFQYQILKPNLIDFIFFLLRIFNFLKNTDSPIEKNLKKQNISYFLSLRLSYILLFFLNTRIIFTIMDICHLEFKFKEVSKFYIYYYRQLVISRAISKSYLILTESSELIRRIKRYFNVYNSRFLSIPNVYSNLLNTDPENNYEINDFLKKFYFYPAQFWEHKNHKLILNCIKLAKDNNHELKFIFAGSDKGYMGYIKKLSKKYGIDKNIKILGYVSDNFLKYLYTSCKAVVFPSFFGPTNLPPLESWYHGKPLICSKLLKSHCGNAALYFDPFSPKELFEKIKDLEIKEIEEKIIINGFNRLELLKTLNIKSFKNFIKFI